MTFCPSRLRGLPRAFTYALASIGLLAGWIGAERAQALTVGISDNSPATFSQSRFKQAGLRKGRLITPWNVAQRQGSAEYANTAAWLDEARAHGVEPSVAFTNHNYGSARARKRPPSARAYLKAMQAFKATFPSVRVITPWNEANHITQPTARHPERAAEYYNITRRVFRGAKIVAADVLDQTNSRRWLIRFRKKAKGNPRIWGLHNYSDINKFRSVRRSYTAQMAKWVPGQIWATEAGGVVSFTTERGERAYPTSQSRAARATRHMFKLLRSGKLKKRYTRVYVYQWFSDPHSRWDSGLTNTDGSVRPAYWTLIGMIKKSGIGT